MKTTDSSEKALICKEEDKKTVTEIKRKCSELNDDSSDEEILPVSPFPKAKKLFMDRSDMLSSMNVLMTDTHLNRRPSESNKQETSQDEEFQREVLRMLEAMQKDIKEIKEVVFRNSPTTPLPRLPISCPQLPCESSCDLEKLELVLHDENTFADICIFLSTIGGTDSKDCTRKVLAKLISNNLSRNYNWKGTRGEKLGFSSFIFVRKLILGAVRKNPNSTEATETSVDMVIKKWLMHAKDRDGGRFMRALNS